jgi:hypothetical protein
VALVLLRLPMALQLVAALAAATRYVNPPFDAIVSSVARPKVSESCVGSKDNSSSTGAGHNSNIID